MCVGVLSVARVACRGSVVVDPHSSFFKIHSFRIERYFSLKRENGDRLVRLKKDCATLYAHPDPTFAYISIINMYGYIVMCVLLYIYS